MVSVTFCGALVVPTFWPANTKLEGERLTAGSVPVPLRLAECGLPTALSVIVKVPLRGPAAEGVKFTFTLQLAPAAREVGQLLVWPNSALTVMLVKEREACPQLVSVTVWVVLVVFTFCAPKFKLPGERQTAGAGGVTVRLTFVV